MEGTGEQEPPVQGGIKEEPTQEEPIEQEATKEEPTKEEPTKEEPIEQEPTKEEPTKEEEEGKGSCQGPTKRHKSERWSNAIASLREVASSNPDVSARVTEALAILEGEDA